MQTNFTPHHLLHCHHHTFSLHLCLPSSFHLPPSTTHLIPSLSKLIPSLPLPATLVLSHPHRRRGLIIISQARPHQETWLLMREKSILLSLLSLFVSSLSLPASIYPLSLLLSASSLLFLPSFLIRQIPRELGAISAAGTGVMCVCVYLCDLGACGYVPDCVFLCVLCVNVCAEAVERAPGWGGWSDRY